MIMDPLFPITASDSYLPSLYSPPSSLDPTPVPFDRLLDLTFTTKTNSSGASSAAIEAQEMIAAYERKLDLLTGMVEQAQIAMNGQQELPGGFSSPAEQTYYSAVSQLRQVSIPGGVLNIV
jgi:hypothetical protein